MSHLSTSPAGRRLGRLPRVLAGCALLAITAATIATPANAESVEPPIADGTQTETTVPAESTVPAETTVTTVATETTVAAETTVPTETTVAADVSTTAPAAAVPAESVGADPAVAPIDPATAAAPAVLSAAPLAPEAAGTDAAMAEPTAVSASGCTVSSKLVPSCGAWLGASTAAKSGRKNGSDYVIGLAEYERAANNAPDILHFYKNGSQQFPTSTEIGMAHRSGKQRALLYYNWKPGGSWASIANGSADSTIKTVATAVQKYDHKVFIAIHHEPEEEVGKSGHKASDFVAMFRRVVTKMRSYGATNVVFVMNYMGYRKWISLFDALYPGDSYVDWIAYDPYGFSAPNYDKFLNDTTSTWNGFYAWAAKKGKPIMLGEWGFDLRVASQAPKVLDGATAIIQSKFPLLKALVYWHDFGGEFLVRLDQSTSLGKAYAAAYSRMANQSYFNSTPTALAP